MYIRHLFLAALCWPMHAMSDNFPSFVSEIPGVQLWHLHADGKSFPFEKFPDGDNEFIRYCDGSRSVYVTVLEAPVKCESKVDADGFHRIYVKTTGKRFSELVVVSKRQLPGRFEPLPITSEESGRLIPAEQQSASNFATQAERYFLKTYAPTSAADYEKYLLEIKSKAIYRKHSGARFKIPSPNGFIYISAIGITADPMGWNIKNVVFREIAEKLQEIGSFDGCIKGFRDLNDDGTPEVLASTCENDEGTSDKFWSLAPEVRRVVVR